MVVESKAVFQGESVIPTPSDVIRTIVTEIEKRKMDTFFDWRVDLKSLQVNGESGFDYRCCNQNSLLKQGC